MEFDAIVYAGLFLVAALAGFIDAIAGGGGLLTTPALLFVGIPPINAIATNKLQSTLGTAMATVNFARAGLLDWRAHRLTVAWVFAGSALGVLAVQQVDRSALMLIIPVLLLAVAGYILLSPRMEDIDREPRLSERGYRPVAGAIGFYDGFFGPGTGSFLTTALVALFGMGLVSATAHTKFLNLSSNVAALVTLVVGGYVLWVLGLLMAVASVAGGQVGAHLALRVGSKVIRPLLVVMALALTVKLLADPANPLTAWVMGTHA